MADYKTIHQTINLPASPQAVYDALMDPKKHAEFTGAKAVINPHVDGRFEVYEGYAVGTFLELVPGEKIVSTWKELTPEWPAGHYSKVTYVLSDDGSGETELEMTHEGVPADRADDIELGWDEYYWEPLEAYLEDEA